MKPSQVQRYYQQMSEHISWLYEKVNRLRLLEQPLLTSQEMTNRLNCFKNQLNHYKRMRDELFNQ